MQQFENIKNYNAEAGTCSWSGCAEEGKFPAPKESMSRVDRYHFCLQHVREYNKSWNFFNKMDEKQIDAFQRGSLSGHRPTWKMGVGAKDYNNVEEVRKQLFENFLGASEDNYKARQDNNAISRLPKQVRDALKVLNLDYPVTIREIKKRYKELAKAHHPDLNGKTNDDTIKTINHAYNVLKVVDCFNS